jgi:son of sevenless-like protein
VKQIILELIDQFELEVDEKQLVLTKQGGTPLVQWVALRNQNVLPGDELSLMKADKKMLEEAEAGHRVNIWKEEESPSTIVLATDMSVASVLAAKGIEKFIEAATLNKLVEYLTSTTAHDVVFMNAFMYTHGTFATSEWVFRKLVERYDVPDSVPEQNRVIVRMRVCLAMKRLVELYLDDSEDDVHLLDKVVAFAKEQVETDPQCASISPVILTAVEDSRKAIASWKAMAARLDAVEPDEAGDAPVKPVGKLGKTMGLNLLQELDEASIARHLAAMDYETFCKIVPREFFNFAWTKKRRALAPNIRQLIDQFNYVSTWVASSIVQARDLKSRVEVVEKLVRIMRHLKELQDFSSLMAFSAAFNNSAILRLKHTMGKLSKKTNAAFEEFDKVLSMEGSYKAYRTALKACTPPCTPYIGVFLMDITFIEEGNQNVTEGGLINFAKRQMLYDVISELEGYMGGSYAETFEKNPMFDVLYKNVPQLDEKTMYAMSLKLEPRGAELRDIA